MSFYGSGDMVMEQSEETHGHYANLFNNKATRNGGELFTCTYPLKVQAYTGWWYDALSTVWFAVYQCVVLHVPQTVIVNYCLSYMAETGGGVCVWKQIPGQQSHKLCEIKLFSSTSPSPLRVAHLTLGGIVLLFRNQ